MTLMLLKDNALIDFLFKLFSFYLLFRLLLLVEWFLHDSNLANQCVASQKIIRYDEAIETLNHKKKIDVLL